MMNGEKVLKACYGGDGIMDESMVMVCMQIITNTGSAKSSYIEAIQKAKRVILGSRGSA